MTRKIAIKRLTGSDLTFFYSHDKQGEYGHQKALNLNTDVFVQKLYPSLPETNVTRFPLDIDIFGPGLAPRYNLQRKIIKGRSYKNWRLNGEFVFDQAESPARFDSLRPDDFVVIEFIGDLTPNAAKLVFIAAKNESDRSIHDQIDNWLVDRKMAAITSVDLAQIFAAAQAPEQHPLNRLLAVEAALEDASLGGIAGIRELRKSVSGRAVSQESLRAARSNAERVGRNGEELINAYLCQLKLQGVLTSVRWVSADNAVAPNDFEVVDFNGATIDIEVKSSEASFERPIHMSMNELARAGEAERYDIYRVFDMTEGSCRLRIAKNVGDALRPLLNWASQSPIGCSVDSLSIQPARLPFEPVIEVTEALSVALECASPEDSATEQQRGADEDQLSPL